MILSEVFQGFSKIIFFLENMHLFQLIARTPIGPPLESSVLIASSVLDDVMYPGTRCIVKDCRISYNSILNNTFLFSIKSLDLGPRLTFSCTVQHNMKFILLINVKMTTITSRINTISECCKASQILVFQHLFFE